MIALVEDVHHSEDVNKSFNIETEINNYRNRLKNQNVIDVNDKKYDYQMGVHYMDLITDRKAGWLCSECVKPIVT